MRMGLGHVLVRCLAVGLSRSMVICTDAFGNFFV